MSDLYNYNFIKTLTERSYDIIDSKTLLTYGMIGITSIVLGAATLYEEIEDTQEGIEEQIGEEKLFETPQEEPSETSGGKSKKKQKKQKKRKTKRKYQN
jgi:hypothetical protein